MEVICNRFSFKIKDIGTLPLCTMQLFWPRCVSGIAQVLRHMDLPFLFPETWAGVFVCKKHTQADFLVSSVEIFSWKIFLDLH